MGSTQDGAGEARKAIAGGLLQNWGQDGTISPVGSEREGEIYSLPASLAGMACGLVMNFCWSWDKAESGRREVQKVRAVGSTRPLKMGGGEVFVVVLV